MEKYGGALKQLSISKAFHTDFVAEELLAENGMSVENLFNEIKKIEMKLKK